MCSVVLNPEDEKKTWFIVLLYMLISLHATVCVVCASVCVCVRMLCWMWMPRPSLVITYIPGVRGQTKP